MIRRCFLAVITAASMAAVAYAQPPFPWWENPVGNGLTLSDAQRNLITQIVSEHRDRLTAERAEAERAEREFEAAVNAESFDYQRGRAAIDQLVRARGVFTQDVSQMILRLRNVLTADQWRSLQIRRGGREGGREEYGEREGKGPRPGGRGRKGPAQVGTGSVPAR